jgi:hypothetical protein
MNVVAAIESYVQFKRQSGYAFEGGQRCLATFSVRTGNIDLCLITTTLVSTYLDESGCASRLSITLTLQITPHFLALRYLLAGLELRQPSLSLVSWDFARVRSVMRLDNKHHVKQIVTEIKVGQSESE